MVVKTKRFHKRKSQDASRKSQVASRKSQVAGGLFKQKSSNHATLSNPATTFSNPATTSLKLTNAIKDKIAENIQLLIKNLQDRKFIILIKIPASKFIFQVLKEFIDSNMVLNTDSQNIYNPKTYRLIFNNRVLRQIISKAQIIYEILNEESKQQITPDNFELKNFIDICLQNPNDFSYNNNNINFLKGLKEIALLDLNQEIKKFSINLNFVESFIY